MIKKITLNTELPLDLGFGSSAKTQAAAKKAQQEAASTALDCTLDVPQFSKVAINIRDPNVATNSRQPVEISATSPGQHFVKGPKKVVQNLRPDREDPNASDPNR